MNYKVVLGVLSALLLTLLLYFFNPLSSYINNRDLLTVESKFTPEEIMEAHRKELIGNKERTYQEPLMTFHPYVLLEVKYLDKNKKTKEGVILWSLVDGEMVISTENWETTSGFQDAILARAGSQEFALLNLLANNKGTLSKEKLQKELALDQVSLNRLIELARQKQLVVIDDGNVSLHFEDPKFLVTPETKLVTDLVIKPKSQGKKVPALFNISQIEKVATAAFGENFTIKSTKEVFLPVLRISVQNGDGTILITDWNALTGQRI